MSNCTIKNKVWTDKQTDRHLNFKRYNGAKNCSLLCPRLPIHRQKQLLGVLMPQLVNR